MYLNYKQMAYDFVKNTEPMPSDVRQNELENLLSVVTLIAEIKTLKKCKMNSDVISSKLKELTEKKESLVFHNEVFDIDS